MGEFEAEEGKRPAGKRGAVVAVVALVAVLAIGYGAYQALAGQARSGSGEGAGAVASGASGGKGADGGAGGKASADAVMLADYDSTVYTVEERPVTLTEIADGKPLVVNFWATWCPYCVREMDDYQAIFHDYEGRVSFAFVDCADGTRERAYDAALWLVENGYDDLPAYYDTTQEAQYRFGASALPTTVVVSAEGEVLAISAGAIDPDLMRSALDSLL